MGFFDALKKKKAVKKAADKVDKKKEDTDKMTTGKNVAVKSRTRAEQAAADLEEALKGL